MTATRSSLENRFKVFLSQLQGSEDIDQVLSNEDLAHGKRADFLLNKRRIVLEIKSLEADPEYKIEQRLAPHTDRPEFPTFFWEAELEEVLSLLPDGEKIRREIFHAITRAVQGALEKADDQIEATKNTLDLPSACGVVAILNEKVGVLAPEVVAAAAHQILSKKRDQEVRYKQLAYVWIISESHRIVANTKKEYLPVILMEGPTASSHSAAGNYLDSLQPHWAKFEKVPFVSVGARDNFEGLTFEKRMTRRSSSEKRLLVRHELWRLSYRASPYLRSLSDEDFLEHAARIITALVPHFLIEGPKLPKAVVAELMEGWTHVLEEAEHRRLDMKRLRGKLPRLDPKGGSTDSS